MTPFAYVAARLIKPSALLVSIVAVYLVSLVNADDHVSRTPSDVVQVQMHNIQYHFTNDIGVHIDVLRGELVPTKGNPMPVFDDKNSFTLRISDALIAIDASSMAAVLNTHVFSAPNSPVKDVSLQVEKDELKVKGKLHSKGDISFELDGTVSATPDGRIRIHGTAIKALHLPVKGLMDFFGVQIATLIKNHRVPGVAVEKNDLILDSQQILPPPHIQGKVAAVNLAGDSIGLVFGTPNKISLSQPHENYMQYKGNRIQFGKLIMNDTDLTLLDMDSKDTFDFYLDHYKEQLVAGYTKTTPAFGLRVYMRDFHKLPHLSATAR